MGLSVAGLGSGLDINSMVQQLVDAERIPKQQRITDKINDIETDISAYGRIKSALDELSSVMTSFRDDKIFASHIASSNNDDIISATASAEAIKGVYSIEVTSLAQSHKTLSESMDNDEVLGTGEITLQLGSQSMTITLAEDAKLIDLVKAINKDEDNPGITASIINDDNGARLVLNADETGAQNQIKVSVDADAASALNRFAFDSSDNNSAMIEMQQARDASILIDGIAEVSSPSNTFTNAIEGVELNVQKLTTTDSGPITILVEEDKTKVKESLEQFVDAYNAFYQVTQSVAKFDPDTGVGGALMGDSLVRSSLSQLRNLFASPIDGASSSLNTLSELGITTTLDGRLEIDTERLDRQLNQNFDDLSGFFAGKGGFATKLEKVVDNFTGFTGSINSRETSLSEQKNRLEDEQSLLEQRMEDLEQRMYRQFSAMDAAMGRMNAQLQTMLSILPTGN